MNPGSSEPFPGEGRSLNAAREEVIQALQQLKCRTGQNTIESVGLKDALGRVSAATVVATDPIPGFRASIMDGYALGQADQPQLGDHWRLVGCSGAGRPFTEHLATGEAIRIMTGAAIPAGSAWVIPQELTQVSDVCQQSEAVLTLVKQASSNPWIRPADEEVKAGDVVVESGLRLTPARLGLAASCGFAELAVTRKPRIGLLISGDELIPPGAPRPAGAIWESNGTLLELLLSRLGYELSDRRVVGDRPQELRSALLELALACDVVVSTGGVSVGDSDWIRSLIAELGDVKFWKLFLKPGRPFAFGSIGDQVPFFGLPGNPVAAAITALQLLWPALQQLEGIREPESPPRLRVQLANALKRQPGRPELARARLVITEQGAAQARIEGSQASSRLGSLLDADLLLEIPADAGDLPPGSHLWAQLLRLPIF